MRDEIKVSVLLLLFLAVVPVLISTPVDADHATCTTAEEGYCQSTMDWSHIFENTEVLSDIDVDPISSSDSSGSGDFVNPVRGLERTDNLLVPTRQEQRNLYQGIWDARSPPNRELMLGSYTDSPRNIFYSDFDGYEYSEHWVDDKKTDKNPSKNEPKYLSTSYFPDWGGIQKTDGFSYADPETEDREEPSNAIVLADGQDRAEFATWDDGTDGIINPSKGSVEEFTWDFGTWSYEGKFDPSVVSLKASVPEDTEILVELYEPVEPSTLRSAESSGNLDEYRLGVARFDDSGVSGTTETARRTSAIRHGDNYEQLGLKETYSPTDLDDISGYGGGGYSSVPGEASTGGVEDLITYNARFVMREEPTETHSAFRTLSEDDDDLNGFESGEEVELIKTPVVEIIDASDGSGNSVSVSLEDKNEGTVVVEDSGFEDLEIKYKHNDISGSPAVELDSSIELGTPIPPYRRGSDPWKGYPAVLPSLSGQAERGEIYNVTHIRNEDYDIDLGHTESMVVNFGRDYLDGSVGEGLSSTDGDYSMKSSFAPRIPQDQDPTDIFEPSGTDRFYHGAAGKQDYHLLSPENVASDSVEHPQVVFHHVYTDVPRVEMSTFWQKDEDGYENIESDEWGTIASKDGVMYAMMDAAANEISYSNSNIRYFDHETKETNRKYDGFSGSDGVDSADLPSYAKDGGYKQEDLRSPVVKMDYTLENLEIRPQVGAKYKYVGGGTFPGDVVPFRQDLTDESFRPSESFVFDYNQSIIEEGKVEVANSDRVEDNEDFLGTDIDAEDLEFDGFYSLVNDTRATYSIDYQMYEFDSNVCPEHYTEVDVDKNDEGDITDISAEDSYAINSYYDHPEADSDIYQTYDDYLQTKSDYGEYYGVDDATGLKACDVPSGETNPDEEYIIEGDWEDIDYTTYDHPELGQPSGWVEHDNGIEVSYNSSDSQIQTLVNGEEVDGDDEDDGSGGLFEDILGGDDDTETELQLTLDENLKSEDVTEDVYNVDKFGFERADEQGPSDGDIGDSFSVQTALGQKSFAGKNRFNRDFEDGLENTRWTRAEATATVKRGTVQFNQLEGSRSVSVPVGAEYGITARYNEPQDITSTEPLEYEIKEGMDVYLDIYNYGPSQPENEEFEVRVDGTVVYETSNLPDGGASTPNAYDTYDKIDKIEITDQVMNEEEISISYNYGIPESEYDSERSEELKNEIDHRFDYVVTIDTNHPIEHISSRWGYSTFRDTTFDTTYEFKDSSCVTDAGTSCYDYQNHSIPSGDLQGNTNYPVDPSNGNPVETTYPSNSMIVHPYLVPTTESLEISDPLGSNLETRPTQNLTNILNKGKISYDNRLEDSGVNVESDGNFIVVNKANTIIKPVREDKPASEPQIYESINFHEWYPERRSEVDDISEFEPLDELPEHRSLSNFPAMMLYGDDQMNKNFEVLEDYDVGTDGDDFEVHDMWFEDGQVMINGTAHNSDVRSFGIDANFAILDFPQTTVSNWPNQGSIADTIYNEGILFGGYSRQDFDEITREDVENAGLGVFSDSEGLTGDIVREDLRGQHIEGTYVAQDQTWVAEAAEVRTALQDSGKQVRLNEVDLSPMNSSYCPYNPNIGQRYCGMNKINLADFNVEYSYRDEVLMPQHIDRFRPPNEDGRNKSAFAEYGSFELETGADAVSGWNIAGDASWETRSVSESSSYKMFDSTRISIEPVKNITEEIIDSHTSSTVDHEFVSESEIEDKSVQQYRLKVEDQQGGSVSFKQRISKTPIVSDVSAPVSEYDREVYSRSEDGKTEGVCIDVEKGGTKKQGVNYYNDCYLTDTDGELYFTVKVNEDEYSVPADQARIDARVVGSEEKWWTYDSGKRLIESSQTTIKTDPLDGEGGSSSATIPQAIIYLLIIIVIFLFVLSLILRIGTNPSQGPTTRDLINIMFGPFAKPAFKRLAKLLLYFSLLSIGVSVFVTSVTDVDISYFFFLEAIAKGIWDTLFA